VSAFARIVTSYGVLKEDRASEIVHDLLGIKKDYYQACAYEVLKNAKDKGTKWREQTIIYFSNQVSMRSSLDCILELLVTLHSIETY
jgi:hypothetical protein